MTTPDTLNPYEQIWQSRDLKALESTPIKLNNKRPEWKKGLNAFVDEMQGTGYGLAALASQGVENVVGPNDITKGITDWGLEGYNRNMEESQAGVNAPKIARVEDVHTASDAMDWASFQLGKGLPMLASLAVPAAIGGTIARFGAKEGVAALAKSAVGDTVKKAVATKALQAAEGDVVTGAMKQAAAKALQDRIAAGAVTGGYLGSFGLEGGQSFGETVAQGVKPEDAVKSAIAVGGINGALEFLPFYSAAKSIGLGQYAKKGIMDIIKSDAGLAKKAVQLAGELGGRAVKGGIVGAGAEGITEGLQELTSIAGERWAKNDPLFADLSEDDWSRVKNSMAAGAITGGVAMGAGATLKGPKATGSTSTDENRPDASSAGGASARSKTREQEIEELRNKINTELEVAIKSGNTARAEQLAGARDMIDMEVAPPVPVQDTPIQEPPAQEPIVQETPVQEVPTTEATPARPDEPIQLKRGEEIILTPPKPGEPETRVVPTEEEKVRLQELMGERPERAPITYDAAAQEVIPNAEEAQPPTETQVTNDTALPTDIIGKIRERMSNVEVGPLENGRKKISFDVDGKHVEGTVNTGNRDFISNKVTPQEGGDVKYSMPLNPNMEVSEASMEEFEAVRKQFQERQKQETPFKNWFGKGTKDITANADGTPITLYHGTNNPTFNQWDSSRAGKASAHPTSGLGFFMTADKGAAARYGNNLMALHAKIQNPYTLTDADLTSIETKEDATKLRKRLMAKGYDGAVVKAPGAKPYVIAFDSKQVKFVTNESPTDSPDMRYSKPLQESKASEPFYSALERATQETKQEKAPANQWLGTLNTMVKKGIVKQEELDWSGTKEWLQEQKGSVTKEALLQHVRDNTLEVQETELGPDQTRNTQWTLPGSENQRELVLTVPSIEPFNTTDTTHYGDVGGGKAVAWVRFNDRVDTEGKKTLFIEEVQSKRHQEGKDKGYSTDIVPNAPFKQTIAGSGQTLSGWAGLAFKRMLRYAAENGYDKVAWTTGEQQAERYNLAKRVAKVAYSTDGFFEAYDKNGFTVISKAMTVDELPNYIGKDLAKDLLSSPVKNEQHIVELSETKVIGGEGMKGFYDRLLPNEINKYVKKWGAKVDKTQMEFGDETADVHSVEVTPAMRDSVMQGQPLFSKPQSAKMDAEYLAAVERGDMETAQKMVDEAAKKAGYTVGPVYHGGSFNQNINPVFNVPEGPVRKNKWQLAFGVHFAETQSDANDYLKKNGALQSAYLDDNMFDGMTAKILSEKDLSRWPDSVRKRIDKLNKQWKNENTYAFQVTQVLDSMAPVQASQAVINAGYAGIKYEARANIDNKSYRPFTAYLVVGDPSQIKSADPITYDNAGNIIPLSQRFNKATSDIRYTQQSGITTVSLQDLQSNIDSIMGQGWLQQAQELGLVEIIEGAGPNGEAGSWAGDRIRLYTNTMPKNGSPAGVLLHEGKHVTFEDVLGNSLPEYVKDLHTLADNGNKVAQDAITHAAIAVADVLEIKHNLLEGGTKADLKNLRALIEQERPGLLAEEELAYFVQYGADAQTGTGFWKRLVNQIKAWFAQTKLGQRMKELGIGFELTDAMAVEWAKMGLQRSLENAQQAAQVRKQVVNEAKLMPPSVRLGRALEAAYQDDPLYSISIQEIKDSLWTNPTDSRVEMVNKPGLLQRWRADFIDFFAEIEKKSKTVYDAFTLLRNKVAARLSQSRQEYYLPLLKEIVGSKWTAKQVGDMLAARHHKVDKVNTRLAERASYGYTKELLKALSKTKRQELMAGRVNVKAGKMPDGSVYMVNGVPATMSAVTKQKLMFDLMNKYSQFEIANADGKQALREEWEIFKDAAGGFSDGGVAKGMVRTVDEVLAPASEDQARFDRIMALFDAMNRHALQIREDGGLITPDEHARLLMDKSAYAPLKRESYNVNTETMRLFQQAGRGGNKNLGTRAGTAELSEPTNVLQNALALLEASAAAAERNLANQELYKVVNADKAAWKPWFHIAAKDEYVTHDEDGFLQEKNSTAVNRADIVLIKDGKKIVIRPNMHNDRAMGFVRAANNLDAQELSGPMKVLGMFNNLVRAVNITFSPIFLMMNAIKDPLTAAYNLQATEGAKHTKEIFVKDYFKTYRNSFRMLKKVFMDGNRDRTDADVKWVERYENAGGRTSFIEQLKENDNTWRSFDAQVARRQGNFKHLMAVKDTWIDGIENLNILFENVMRFSTFRVLVEKGMSDTDAARIAQDLTTNFSRRGYKSQALGLWWLFFNASVQGNYQVVRNLMKSKRLQVLSLGTIAFAVMLDLLGRAIADDWDEIPEWDKERFIIIPVKVDGDYVKIPAPWVYNTLWRTGGLIGEMFSGVKEPQDALLDMAAMTATTFNPLGKPGSIAQAIAPTAADPFIQILENKDFAGNPIGPEGYPGASKKANSELLWSSTPKGYQSIARFVNEVTGGSATESGGIDLKPGDYQLLAKFLTGSMGRFLTDSTFGFAEDVKKGIEGPKDIPVIREFFSDPYDPLTVQKYHTNIASIYGAHRLERMYREGPDRDLIKLQEVRSERGEELRMYSQAQDVERQLKSLRVRLKAAQARDDVGREKQLKERMAQVQEQFNAAYRQRVN